MSDTDKDNKESNDTTPTTTITPTITHISTTDITNSNEKIKSKSPSISNNEIKPISPPEIPTTTTTTTTTKSYAPVTGQSQSVTTQRHNPISATTIAPITETKTDEQTLLNQYTAATAQYYLPTTLPTTAALGTNALGTAGLVGALGGVGGVGGVGGLGVGGQQYLLYNQLNNYNGALLRAQLMAQRVAQLQSLNNGNSQQWVLFVFHLPEDMDDNGLLLLFSSFGATQAIVMRHKNTDCSRGFGFVHFRTKNEAQIAIDMMNGYQIGHKRLRVSWKKSKE